jgi:hypothetical protein
LSVGHNVDSSGEKYDFQLYKLKKIIQISQEKSYDLGCVD